jgi:circadian clock protein KaiC
MELLKCATGIRGFDEITEGGLPQGRPTLVCGNTGCGKTLFAMEFLMRGATEFGEPGVCFAFEERPEDLIHNVASLGFDLNRLIQARKLAVEHVFIEPNEIQETGDYDLEGLFVRLGYAIDSIGAKRVVLDTLEALFGGLSNLGILRAELRRLFRWLKEKGVTAVITGESGDGSLTRHGLEEFVSDCVVVLDHKVDDMVLTRRLRVVEYRGSTHGTNEYPFLIDRHGISVFPITGLELKYPVSNERISSGLAELDTMLGGGYFRGSTVLVGGTPGTGKTSLVAYCLEAACRRGERAVYFGFEESPAQLARNMKSIGLDLDGWTREGLLHIEAHRATSYGLEKHLLRIHETVNATQPVVVAIDPATTFLASGSQRQAETMVLRTVDFLKSRGITTLLTSLTASNDYQEGTSIEISSAVDTWILLRSIELAGERNRGLYVLKSRGSAHSNQIREFILTDRGVVLREAYLGANGVLTGSARLTQEMADRLAELERSQEFRQRQTALLNKRKALESQVEALRAEMATCEEELNQIASQEEIRARLISDVTGSMALGRGVSQEKENSTGSEAGRTRKAVR